jgi:hypothetical protein
MANIPTFTAHNNPTLYNDELSQSLQGAIGKNGFKISELTSDQIDSIFSESEDGTIWWDTDRGRWVGNRSGALVGIVTESL